MDSKQSTKLEYDTKQLNTINSFDTAKQSVNILREMKNFFEAHHDVHEKIIDEIFDFSETNVEKVNEDFEKFHVVYGDAVGSLKDKLDITVLANGLRKLPWKQTKWQ